MGEFLPIQAGKVKLLGADYSMRNAGSGVLENYV